MKKKNVCCACPLESMGINIELQGGKVYIITGICISLCILYLTENLLS